MTSQRFSEFSLTDDTVDSITYKRTTIKDTFLSKIPLLKYFDYINQLAKSIEEKVLAEKPDIIQAHSPMFNALAALKVSRKYNIPVTYEVRAFWEDAAIDTGKTKEGSLRYNLIKNAEQYALSKVDKISVICIGLKDELIRRGISKSKIFVTPNAVDIDKFVPQMIRDTNIENELGLANKKVVAFIGSFFKYEGLQYAIDAFKKIIEVRRDIHLLLVGDGNESDNLKKQVLEQGLTDYITFTGKVPYDEVYKYYSVADLMVFPREDIRLTQLVTPLKPLESMAQLKPVIASDIGGHRELIEDGKTGFLFKPDCSLSLADKILAIIDDEKSLKNITTQGLSFVTDTRNWINTAKAYLPEYEELITKRSN
jgi:PEP-CTERM/exosortase A-associated glycosyltransferase